MYVHMYITAFASISSFAVEIEVLLFAVNVNVENLKPRRNPVRVESHVFTSEEFESKQRKYKDPRIKMIYLSEFL